MSDKACTKCGTTKPLAEFHRDSSKHDGRYPTCRRCRSVPRKPATVDHWQDFIEVLDDGCWLWTGTRRGDGYGLVRTRTRKSSTRAHRFVYESLVGEIADDAILHHVCDNPQCVNPEHLEPLTRSQHAGECAIAKLDGGKVREIRRLHSEGMTTVSLSDVFGVHNSVVNRVVHRKAWKHVA